jgi:hypothetical protein
MPSGAFRFVLLLGAFAFKFPRYRNIGAGMRSNRWEREMWQKWQPIFKWTTLCPVYFADPAGFLVIMPRALQPVSREEVEAMPDYYPAITSETKVEDHGRLGLRVVALDYGLPDQNLCLNNASTTV